MLARAASDAVLIVNFREEELPIGNHVDSFRWTVLRASSAVGLLRFDDAVFFCEMRFSDLYQFLFGLRELCDGAGGAHLSAESAIVRAIVDGIVHPRLHDACEAELEERWLQDVRWA